MVAWAAVAGFAAAQTPPLGTSPGRQAIEARKAAFTLIGGNFRPLAAVLKGDTSLDKVEAQKRASRVAFLAGLLDDVFPDSSNLGEPETKATPDIWTHRSDFDKRLKDFQEHAGGLVRVSAAEAPGSDGFKAAVAAVAQDCKGCHETFKVK